MSTTFDLDGAVLPPTKIKRQYKCTKCPHVTINPRLHLRHRIFMHDQKLKIVECPLCVYACQYRQKLNRHLRLVHHCTPDQLPKNPSVFQPSNYSDASPPYHQSAEQPTTSSSIHQQISQSIASNHPLLKEIYAFAKQIIQDNYISDEQPLDLSFPREVKQLIQSIENRDGSENL